MQARLIIGGLFVGLGFALWFLTNANAEARANLKHEQERSEALAQTVAGVAEEYNKRLKAQEEAVRVRDSIRHQADARRKAAEERINRESGDEVVAWRHARVPTPVTDSLCLQPGSCAVPGTGEATSTPTPAGTRNAAIGLNNESLRQGVEDLRGDLATCNGQLAGLQAWADSLTERK